DHGGARAETSLARDPARPAEAPPVDGRHAREGADAEVLEIGGVAGGAHLELVPEVERDRSAVEARSDVRGAGGRAYAQRLRQARRLHRDQDRPQEAAAAAAPPAPDPAGRGPWS